MALYNLYMTMDQGLNYRTHYQWQTGCRQHHQTRSSSSRLLPISLYYLKGRISIMLAFHIRWTPV